MNYPPPNHTPVYNLGPSPHRSLPQSRPRFVLCDASIINESNKIFPIKANDGQYARYEAFSPKNANDPVILVTTPREVEVVDWLKQNMGKGCNTDCWIRGTGGKGIVKEYSASRTSSYLEQTMIVSASDLERCYVGGCTDDIPQQVEAFCPVTDEERNDIRLASFLGCIIALLRQHPTAEIMVYLRGDRIAGRFNTLLSVVGSLAQAINSKSKKVISGQTTAIYLKHLDELLETATFNSPSPPLPHPLVTSPPNFTFATLNKTKDGTETIMGPESIPLFATSTVLTPETDTVIRILADTNEHSRHSHQLVDFVKRLEGNLQMAALPEIYRELNAGRDRLRAANRNRHFWELMNLRPSILHSVPPGKSSWFYGADQAPARCDAPTGDLRVRPEMKAVMTELEANHAGQNLIVLFVTNDYNVQLLLRALAGKSATFLCIRTEKKDVGARVVDVLSNVLKPWLKW